jgi:hypothetical protein
MYIIKSTHPRRMQVFYRAFSKIRTEHVPEKYRVSLSEATEAKRQQLKRDILWAAPELQDSLLYSNGASYGENGTIFIAPRIEFSDDLIKEFYGIYKQNPDFLCVNWYTNTIYLRTPDTLVSSVGLSFLQYTIFKSELFKCNNGVEFYMPPQIKFTDDLGFLTPEKCKRCLEGLNAVRLHFVRDEWVPHANRDDVYEEGESDEPSINEWSVHFRDLYTAMTLGADAGTVSIS